MTSVDPLTLLDLFLIVIPYPFYTWAYKYPNSFKKYISQERMIKVSVVDKWLSLGLMVPASFRSGLSGPGLILGAWFVFIGQYLNELVFSLMGDKGVFYGLEFHTVAPRKISGFPFTLHDPQYKGSFLTVLGWFLIVNPTQETVLILAAWTLAYFSQMIVENTTSGYILNMRKTDPAFE